MAEYTADTRTKPSEQERFERRWPKLVEYWKRHGAYLSCNDFTNNITLQTLTFALEDLGLVEGERKGR